MKGTKVNTSETRTWEKINVHIRPAEWLLLRTVPEGKFQFPARDGVGDVLIYHHRDDSGFKVVWTCETRIVPNFTPSKDSALQAYLTIQAVLTKTGIGGDVQMEESGWQVNAVVPSWSGVAAICTALIDETLPPFICPV